MMGEWIKALHIISVITWMAGLLYLPRLYVYHCQVTAGSDQSETFKVMERRLLRIIMNPAMVATWGFGLWLVWVRGVWVEPWFHAKLLLVILMTGFHMALAKWRRDFAADTNCHGGKFYRFANEVPTIVMSLIVILAVVKPF